MHKTCGKTKEKGREKSKVKTHGQYRSSNQILILQNYITKFSLPDQTIFSYRFIVIFQIPIIVNQTGLFKFNSSSKDPRLQSTTYQQLHRHVMTRPLPPDPRPPGIEDVLHYLEDKRRAPRVVRLIDKVLLRYLYDVTQLCVTVEIRYTCTVNQLGVNSNIRCKVVISVLQVTGNVRVS